MSKKKWNDLEFGIISLVLLFVMGYLLVTGRAFK